MGIFDKLLNKSKIAKRSELKINNQKDLEEYLDIIVYWPSLWERIKSGEKVDSNNFSIKDQLKALINAGEVIGFLNGEKENIVFFLWGAYAQKKGESIDRSRHLVLESVHPSPLSASRGFFGNRHFSKCNEYLVSKGIEPIDWR